MFAAHETSTLHRGIDFTFGFIIGGVLKAMDL